MSVRELRLQERTDGATDNPVVSIICETYNHESYITEALDGFLMQEVDFPVEIIVHDDASEDGTSQIVNDYAATYSRLIRPILQEENQYARGIRARRYTYGAARGQFIALCEGDDYWTGAHKLQKQVEALRRHPEIDLCVHPAWCLSVRTGWARRAFVRGGSEHIVPVDSVVARHDQFAPTASVVMRTAAARTMPEWWFQGEPPPPAGDCFLEAILGRKGVLYVPDLMAVYRRGVPGSYTSTFERAAGDALEAQLQTMLDYVARLNEIEGMPGAAVARRAELVRLNYALQFLAARDQERFAHVVRAIGDTGMPGVVPALRLMAASRPVFAAGRLAFRALRRLRS